MRFRSRAGRERRVLVPARTTLLAAARRAQLPLGSACDGAGLCARCGLRVLDGGERLAAETPDEARAKLRNRVPPELRLACQVSVESDLRVGAEHW